MIIIVKKTRFLPYLIDRVADDKNKSARISAKIFIC
jgi:hypothetical protein